MLTIRDVRTIVTRPFTQNLVIVKVETSEPGLDGLGCATFTQRYKAVVEIVESYLKPLLVGRDPRQIEELWQLVHQNGYWRNGPVVNNALGGVDMALWDLKGRMAGMPVYELMGGKCREAAPVYEHAAGLHHRQLLDNVQRLKEQGLRHVRVQISPDPHASPGQLRPESAGYGGSMFTGPRPDGALDGIYYDPRRYQREMIEALEMLRSEFGHDLELLHDVHERLAPAEAVAFAKALEPFDLFFLEDPLPPEHLGWLANIREACSTSIAIGELFVHAAEWLPLVAARQIDFIRMHVSALGGVTPARKAAVVAEAHGVRTAWHGPKDTSPVGHAANLHLDLVCPNFGIQEFAPFTDAERAIFDGLPECREGFLYANDRPGFGIDLDEAAAAAHPPQPDVIQWTQSRRPDGALARP